MKETQDRLHFSRIGVLLPLIILVIALGCGGSDTEAAKGAKVETPEPVPVDAQLSGGPDQVMEVAEAEVAEPADPNEVVATVDGDEITRGQLDREVDGLMRRMFRGANMQPHAGMREQFEQQAMDGIILKHEITAYADQEGLSVTDEEVDQALAEVKDQFPSEEQFDAMLKQMDVTMEDVRNDIRENTLLRKAVDHYLAGLPEPSTPEIEDFYEENIQRFQEGEKVTASHILISATPGMSEEEQAAAKAEAEDIRNQILNGADFAEMAKEYSADVHSGARGGELGSFERGRMVAPFEEAAFGLDIGEISEPVKTQFGYHLIKVSDHIDAGTRELGEVRDIIIRQLQQKDFMDWRTKLLDDADVKKMSGESGEQP
jgi:parvulin-like peptidyl-prolyl isomerase